MNIISDTGKNNLTCNEQSTLTTKIFYNIRPRAQLLHMYLYFSYLCLRLSLNQSLQLHHRIENKGRMDFFLSALKFKSATFQNWNSPSFHRRINPINILTCVTNDYKCTKRLLTRIRSSLSVTMFSSVQNITTIFILITFNRSLFKSVKVIKNKKLKKLHV